MAKKKPKLTELLGNTPESKRYTFKVDPDEVLQQKGDVVFIMGLNKNVDPNAVKLTLEEMSADVGYATYMENLRILVCVTNQATYERAFQTQLELDQIKKGQTGAGYTPEGYRELKAATVPKELSDKVYGVHLNITPK